MPNVVVALGGLEARKGPDRHGHGQHHALDHAHFDHQAAGLVDSRFKGNTSLRNNRVPQVATYNLAAGLRHAGRGWTTAAQVRVTGPQFEDDQNLLTLRRATVVDVYVGRSLRRVVQLFFAVENLFDSVYDVSCTPILTTGLPRAARAGVQIALP
jgi:outer membrane receptor protein involved in Fe transport